MGNSTVHLPVLGFGQTMRKDAWWAGPVATVAILLGFIVYATFRAFENNWYDGAHAVASVQALDLPYLSPFYSPLIDTSFAKGWPIPLTPAMLILAGPASFRFTCYYYRKAYYRAFAMDPPACAVGERKHKYNGETRLLIFQNLHRFAMYVALFFIVWLTKDVVEACMWARPGGGAKFGLGIGTIIMAVNVVLIGAYTFGCHSFRHFIGGSVNSYSTAAFGKLRHGLWRMCTFLNQRHQLFAWASLFSVALTDVYLRFVYAGVIPDVRLI